MKIHVDSETGGFMIQDLHNHTYYSFCGNNSPEEVVEAAIEGGIELFGICDHNHGIGYSRRDVFNLPEGLLEKDYGRNLIRYFDHINLIKEKYADRIKILRGIEVTTQTERRRAALPHGVDISFFDYCLMENLDRPDISIAKGDPFAFAERCGCPMGIAHTDMFAFLANTGNDPYKYFKKLADAGIFWEMNVSFDSTHHYREHQYVIEFFNTPEQQQIVRESGLRLSVGFDGHKAEDYLPERVKDACKKITDMGIKLAFED